MLEQSLTKQEKHLTLLLKWWAFIFTVACLGFAIFQNYILEYINIIGGVVFKWERAPIPISSEKFWLVLTISLMVTLIYSAIQGAKDVVKNIAYVKIILISKLVSTLGYLIFFVISGFPFAYLAGAIIDGLILIITYIAYKRAYISRYIK